MIKLKSIFTPVSICISTKTNLIADFLIERSFRIYKRKNESIAFWNVDAASESQCVN